MQGVIPEISDTALRLMTDLYNSPVPTAVFLREDEGKDDPILFARYFEANRTWDEMLALGFIENIRETDGKWLADVEWKTGRVFRMFKLSEFGRQAMAMIVATKDEKFKN